MLEHIDMYTVLMALGIGLVVGIYVGYKIGQNMAEMLRARFDMMRIWHGRRIYRDYF